MLTDFSANIAATPSQVAAAAVAAEADGYDGFGAPESRHDVFTGLTLAAAATTKVSLQSEIAVAFARNPMTLAILGNDLQLVSAGRFRLGMGSQVKAHIERRFAMPWSKPAARMEEFVAAIRAIWRSWESGERLVFEGQFYNHTLMTDFFNPGPNPHGNPPVILAAVGERMTQVAARVADGMLCHSFTTPRYVEERTRPALQAVRGSLTGFTIALPALVVLGDDEAQRAKAEAAVRAQIAFYGSTPAYRPVLELHGWQELHERLNRLSRQQAWDDMAAAIPDEVLDAFSVAGTAPEVAAALQQRYGGLVDRLSLYTPYEVDPAQLAAVATALHATD